MTNIHIKYTVPLPTNCTAKVAKFNGDDYTFFQWNRVEWDDAVNYDITYLSNGQPGDTTVSSNFAGIAVTNARTALIKNGALQTTFVAKYTSPVEDASYSASVSLTCTTTTLEPTDMPTAEPTASPIQVPTTDPTPAPTKDLPGVYMLGSGLARENCVNELRTCCTPFGPQFTDNADQSEGATIPTKGCEVYRTDIVELQESQTEDVEHSISFEKYGEAEDAETTVNLYMYSYGLINMTDFTGLNFTGNYTNDGVIGGILKYFVCIRM